MSSIFEEAIADVKKLKEVAEKNAKNAIIESVTPRIRDYVEKQIFESENKIDDNDSEEDSKDESDDEVSLDQNEILEMASLLANKNINEGLINKAYSKLDERNKQKISSIANKIKENNKTFTKSKIDIKETTQRGNNMSDKFYEIDLKLLRESVQQEAEAHKLAEMYADDMDMDMDMEGLYEADEDMELPEEESEDMDMDMDSEDAAGGEGGELTRDDVEAAVQDLITSLNLDMSGAAGGDLDMEMPSEEESEEPSEEESEEEAELPEELQEVFDVDPRMLREEIANVRRMLGEGKMDHHFGGKGSGNVGHKNAFGGTGAKKAGYQNSFGGGSYGKDVFTNPPSTLKKLNEAKRMLQKLNRENRVQNEKLNKYRSAVQTLREQLEDLNLFNAKLLYVNKLLQNKSLNESQKRSVIKALDEARSLGETQALYKSLTESLKADTVSTKMLSESTRLGSSSRSTRSSSFSENAEAADMSRWQKLAGLK